MPLRLLIVDDEPLALLRLRSVLASLPAPQPVVVGEASNAPAALQFLQHTAVDAVLLDIGLPGLGANAAHPGGLRVAAQLRQLPQPPALIFVTAHAEHALQAFELNALDYLTKPVRRERLVAALARVQAAVDAAGAAAAAAAFATAETPAPLPVLVVTERDRVLRLPLADVLYCKAEQKYVTLRTALHSHLLDEPLADLEQRLASLGGQYIRVHRNALVALHAIRALELRLLPGEGADAGLTESWAVQVAPLDEWLAVSRRQVAVVRAALVTAAG
jgi:two-component system, LytTR family, response regulator AlgR